MVGAVLGTNWKTEELEEISGCQIETAASVPQLLQHGPALNPCGNDDLLGGSLQLMPWVGSAKELAVYLDAVGRRDRSGAQVGPSQAERRWGLRAGSKEPCKELCARPAYR